MDREEDVGDVEGEDAAARAARKVASNMLRATRAIGDEGVDIQKGIRGTLRTYPPLVSLLTAVVLLSTLKQEGVVAALFQLGDDVEERDLASASGSWVGEGKIVEETSPAEVLHASITTFIQILEVP